MVIEHFRASRFGADGSVHQSLAAASARHFPDDDSVDFTAPSVRLIEPGRPRVSLDAAEGTLSGDRETIVLRGNVRAVRDASPARRRDAGATGAGHADHRLAAPGAEEGARRHRPSGDDRGAAWHNPHRRAGARQRGADAQAQVQRERHARTRPPAQVIPTPTSLPASTLASPPPASREPRAVALAAAGMLPIAVVPAAGQPAAPAPSGGSRARGRSSREGAAKARRPPRRRLRQPPRMRRPMPRQGGGRARRPRRAAQQSRPRQADQLFGRLGRRQLPDQGRRADRQRRHHAGHADHPRRPHRRSSRTPTTRCRSPPSAIRSRSARSATGTDE